jgi:DNA polymerase-4
VETTLARDLVTSGQCRDVLESLLPELRKRLRGRTFKSVTVKLKFHDFQQTTAAGQAVQLRSDILDAVLNTAYARAAGRRVRLVGISVTLDETPPSEQLSLGF